MSLQLNYPLWLLGFPILVALVWWGHRLRWRFTYIPHQRTRLRPWQSWVTLWSTALTGACILLSLSGPILTYPATRPKLPPIWVLWDVSHSMRNTDRLPDRRHYALRLWEEALDSLNQQEAQSKMGLIVFAQGAYGLLPLTTDRETFRWALRQAIVLDLGEGTDLAEALEMAITHAQPGTHLLIVSDGAHNNPLSADLRQIAEAAAARAIPIHALWVGQDSATTFPQTLQHLSERTHGRFWNNTLSLRPLYRYETLPVSYPLQKIFLWAALLAAFIMGIALSLGWFNLLSA
jgi:hypothetical protein